MRIGTKGVRGDLRSRLPRRVAGMLVLMLTCAALSETTAAQAASCGSLRHAAIGTFGTSPNTASVFTYRYGACRRARATVRAYLDRVPSLASCGRTQASCARTIGRWKCRMAYEHGTLARCVPVGAPWSAVNRPLVGLSR